MSTLLWLVLLIGDICVFAAITLGPSDTRSELGEDVSLECTLENGDQAAWDELTENGLLLATIFIGPFITYTAAKYENFEVSGTLPNNNLHMSSATIEDEGTYQCRVTGPGGDTASASLIIEAPPTSVYVQCSSATGDAICPDTPGNPTSNQFICTCSAAGAHPDDLQLRWNGTTGSAKIPPSKNITTGLFDYISTATITPAMELKQVICYLDGYESQIDLEEKSSSYSFAPPVCSLTARGIAHDCQSVTLVCECGGSPSSDEMMYIFHDGNESVIGEGQTNTITYDVLDPEMGNYHFYCRGCNGVNYGANSMADASFTCVPVSATTLKSTFFADTTTPASRSITLVEGEVCTVPIVVVAVESVVIITMTLLFGWYMYRSRKNSKGVRHGTRSSADGHEGTKNQAYMDLQERNGSDRAGNFGPGIPVRNVKVISNLPGQGLMTYQRAILTAIAGDKDAVVKSPADDGSIKLEKKWSSELLDLRRLPKNVNVVDILGWCCSVPSMLLFDYVNGENLKKHLTENFSSHKVHQYGNTKQKRFEVPETGRMENLPRFALDIARGLKFLLFNEFIHPGLRAQKILFDKAGRCKIYDFVSVSRAKDLTSLLWVDSAPYQWMPPEFLLLDTIAAPGDVWSFGVLLWEIYSYGSQPYPGEDRRALESSLREKRRLPMPRNCPGAVWQLMNRCWGQTAEMRPTMNEIAAKLAAMCNDDKEYDLIPANTTTV